MSVINLGNLEDFIRGTAILGTGGGGDPYIGRLMLEQELRTCGEIRLIDPENVPDDLFAVSVACMGAPTVFVEKLPNVATAIDGIRRMEKEVDRSFNAIIPLEAGGLNATLPLLVAARLGLPVVDGDGMGRAFPEFQMTTFNIYDVNVNPFVMSDDFGNTVVIETDTAIRTETYGRPVCVKMGGIAQVASYPMNGVEVRRSCVPRTVSLALEIGETVRRARIEGNEGVCETLVDYFKASNPPRFSRVLFDGKVQDVVRETSAGFTVGKARLTGLADEKSELLVTFQNEFSHAVVDGRTVALVPDLITVLDRETGEPITTETLCYGQRVKVLGIAAVDVMRTKEALVFIGPRAFAIDEDFRPLETLAWE